MTAPKTPIPDSSKLEAAVADIAEMKSLMGRMVEAIQRIALLEERQGASAQTQNKILETVEDLRQRQHEAELVSATNYDLSARVKTLESAVRDHHIEREKDKARFDTLAWTIRALWAVAGSGALLWAAKLTNLLSNP
jgi:hypothetical protein